MRPKPKLVRTYILRTHKRYTHHHYKICGRLKESKAAGLLSQSFSGVTASSSTTNTQYSPRTHKPYTATSTRRNLVCIQLIMTEMINEVMCPTTETSSLPVSCSEEMVCCTLVRDVFFPNLEYAHILVCSQILADISSHAQRESQPRTREKYRFIFTFLYMQA